MNAHSIPNTLEYLDQELTAVVGVDASAIEQDRALKALMPMAYFNRLMKLIDRSGAVELLEGWAQRSTRGRPAMLSPRTTLVLLLLHNHWGHPNTYVEYARTIQFRLSIEQRRILGIQTGGLHSDWYYRMWRAMDRALRPLDPWHLTQKRRKLTGKEYQHAVKMYNLERKPRANQLMAKLVRASVEMLPKRYLKDYRGDIAIDATFVEVMGAKNPMNPELDRWNVDFTGTRYSRGGNHAGEGKNTDKFGLELETVTMNNIKGGDWFFPLITGAGTHEVAAIKDVPREAFLQHVDFSKSPGHLVCDRAYNHLKAFRFQEVVRKHGYWTVYDFPKDELGPQVTLEDHPVTLVDGSLYVAYMPHHLQMISRWWKNDENDPATGAPYTTEKVYSLLEQREPYRLKPLGRPDKRGSQRFQYPNPRGYLAIDPATGLPLAPREAAKLIGKITVRHSEKVTRSIQKYPWYSKEWHQAYGQRNQVESSNKTIKDVGSVELGNARRRTGRGITFHSLICAFAVVSINIRRIITGITRTITEKPETWITGSECRDHDPGHFEAGQHQPQDPPPPPRRL